MAGDGTGAHTAVARICHVTMAVAALGRMMAEDRLRRWHQVKPHVSRMRCSASDSEAVHRWSGTVAKAVCVTVPGLQRIIPLRSMLRSARDTRLT